MVHLASRKQSADSIRAAIIAKCNEALECVSNRTVSAKDFHTARKAVKKARAWLRLLRAGTPSRVFRNHDHVLRDAARPLSAGRDAQILIDTLRRLLKRFHEPAIERRFGRFERAPILAYMAGWSFPRIRDNCRAPCAGP